MRETPLPTEEIHLHPLTLRIVGNYAGLPAAELEARFDAVSSSGKVAYHRGIAMIGGVMYAAFVYIDYLIAYDVVQQLWFFLFVFALPSLFGTWLLTYTPFYRRHPQGVAAVAMIGISIAQVGRCAVVDATSVSNVYFGGLMIMIVGIYLMANISFAVSTLLGGMTTLGYSFVVIAMDRLSPGVVTSNVQLAFTANVFGMYALYMHERLVRRDFLRQLKLDLLERRERDRLAAELGLAKSLQANFLPRAPLPASAHLEVASLYVPATEVAGDWYQYFHDERHGETIVAMADVSGHGAGSAMFTAIVGGLFELARLKTANRPFDVAAFVHELDACFFRLGHGAAHVTLVVAVFREATGDVSIFNAGHPPPLLIDAERGDARSIDARASGVIGLGGVGAARSVILPFPVGATLLIYTDGFMIGRSMSRVLRDMQRRSSGFTGDVGDLLRRAVVDWQLRQIPDDPHSDDTCIVALRRRATAAPIVAPAVA